MCALRWLLTDLIGPQPLPIRSKALPGAAGRVVLFLTGLRPVEHIYQCSACESELEACQPSREIPNRTFQEVT